jgi:hypothetical protein
VRRAYAKAFKAGCRVCSRLLIVGFRSRALNLLYPSLPNRLSNIVSDFRKNSATSFWASPETPDEPVTTPGGFQQGALSICAAFQKGNDRLGTLTEIAASYCGTSHAVGIAFGLSGQDKAQRPG